MLRNGFIHRRSPSFFLSRGSWEPLGEQHTAAAPPLPGGWERSRRRCRCLSPPPPTGTAPGGFLSVFFFPAEGFSLGAFCPRQVSDAMLGSLPRGSPRTAPPVPGEPWEPPRPPRPAPRDRPRVPTAGPGGSVCRSPALPPWRGWQERALAPSTVFSGGEKPKLFFSSFFLF